MSAPTYSPPPLGPEVDLDLSRNEGKSAAADLISGIADPNELIRRYPDTDPLRRRLARLNDVDEDQVLVTAGGDDGLLRCFLARLGPGLSAVATKPTFEMIPIYANQTGSRLVEVDWWGGAFPKDDVVAAAPDAAAVFVVSPNNPTGTTITVADLASVAEAARFVVLDAAYAEFADEDLTAPALEMGNVVVVRTLSKAYGLAGLRVGYLLGPPDLIAELSSFGSPYPVSALSGAIALDRLKRPEEDTAAVVTEIRTERDELATLLEALGSRPLPSQGNFVLTETADDAWLVDGCASLGIGLRRFPGREDLTNWVRITLPGDRPDFDRLQRTLRTVLVPETILFDLDGVLADVSGSYRLAIIETAASFGVTVTPADIDEAKASGSANDDWELTRRLCRERGVDLALSDVVARFEEIYQGGDDGNEGLKAAERPLVDPSTWSRWASKFPLGVVTGRPRADAEEFLDRYGLSADTSVLVTRDNGPLKPDPQPVRLALQKLGFEHGWLVGDTPDDIEAARSARVVPIGVLAPNADRQQARRTLTRAARILDRTLDLEELLP